MSKDKNVNVKAEDDKEDSSLELPKALTAKKNEDFSKWYNQILVVADILDKRFNVKGCFVWRNYGYETMLNIKKIWDKMFKEQNYKEMYFPLLVPLEYASMNDKWWNSFKDQAFYVKGLNEKKHNYILRPTGEPAIYPMFSLWIRSYRDLPLRVYETVSSFRYETKHTRPLIRDREITVWHEIHTAHATMEESKEEIKNHMRMWDKLWKDLCLIPFKVNKPKEECFPGSVGAVEYYSIMPSGKIMENGSCNNLGQAYAKKFNIKFKKADGTEDYAWMTCTGNGGRLLAAVIGTHGDDHGLILPPKIAPYQVVIIPIFKPNNKKEVMNFCRNIEERLTSKGIRVLIDDSDENIGSKFYEWEIKGVPVRLEIGSKEVSNNEVTLFRRDLRTKEKVKVDSLDINKALSDIESELLRRAKKEFDERIVEAENLEELKKVLNDKKVAKVHWCGSTECSDKIKELADGVELFGTDINEESEGKCVICGKKTKTIGYIANTY